METALSRRRFLETAAVTAVATEAFAADPIARPASIRIGQIGVKHGHATKLGVYRRSPDYEVVGVVESDAEARRKVNAEPAYAGLPWMTREQLLAMPGLQAVLVETAVPDLLDNAEACIAAGKHVHLDKPAGTSLPQYRRILDAAAEGTAWGATLMAKFRRLAIAGRLPEWTPFLASHASGTPTRFTPRPAQTAIYHQMYARYRRLVALHETLLEAVS